MMTCRALRFRVRRGEIFEEELPVGPRRHPNGTPEIAVYEPASRINLKQFWSVAHPDEDVERKTL